jgi:ribonuclease HIII
MPKKPAADPNEPPPLTTYTVNLTAEQAGALRGILLEEGSWEWEQKPYTLYAAKRGKLNIAVYEKGPKIVVQGRETREFVEFTLEPRVLGEAKLGYEELNNPEMYEPHIGLDESGKGDFFGPLVIAGVYTDGPAARALIKAGAQDSKAIGSDKRIREIAAKIRETPGVAWEVVVIGPKRYNEMHTSFGNLNRLLAWGHATTLEAVLQRVPDCPRAVADQFANEAVLKRALKERGKLIELQQRTKGESDVAVAAASILAREGFVEWLDRTGKKLGVTLPKGASAQVKEVAKSIYAKQGAEVLDTLCKRHFKTYGEVTGIVPAGEVSEG